ncbi:MAG: bifunctional phosphopantothenoylcysteine decarboxylase/phosphopantothenate--cysteine ligase CoaBC [bacterium]|nr:bifunctional phosphopantothenoylcysteine decarboxylase/phosphopantothenate--cysteine ligase CoaBC [bacterium]
MKFRGKKILIGITGGIAAYKICWLIRSIKKQGGKVRVIITRSGERFVTRTTIEALSGESAASDLFDPEPAGVIPHIELTRWADCFIVAPATANIIAKTVNGIADDLLSTAILSYPGKVLFAPAMNDEMWKNEVTQKNIKKIKKRKHILVEPESGDLACETVGIGRMAEPEILEQRICEFLNIRTDLSGKKILVTAGGTEENIDPVRFIGNRSSGKMGFAIAQAAYDRGAEVMLITGRHSAALPDNVKVIEALTAKDMKKQVLRYLKKNDALIMAAAVADYRPAVIAKNKIKKEDKTELSIGLEQTEDILASIKDKKSSKVVVGFALETNDGIRNAKKKLKNKDLDIIILNDPMKKGSAFGSDTNKITIIEKGRKKIIELPVLPKYEAAGHILDRVADLLK